MIDSNHSSADDRLDLLLDLKHDLGKYLCLPLSMLAQDATEAEVRASLSRALFETRSGPRGTKSATAIWREFLVEADSELLAMRDFEGLKEAVEAALNLSALLEDGSRTTPTRDGVLEVMQAVSTRIQMLIKEITREK